jgi:hypothetical protein
MPECENCGDPREFLEYCSECDEELCDGCWDEEMHEEHDNGEREEDEDISEGASVDVQEAGS